jgi:hypothetical protein
VPPRKGAEALFDCRCHREPSVQKKIYIGDRLNS